MLFENADATTEHRIRKIIETAVQNDEVRVELRRVNVQFNDDNSQLNIRIEYRLLNSSQPVSTDIFIDRVR